MTIVGIRARRAAATGLAVLIAATFFFGSDSSFAAQTVLDGIAPQNTASVGTYYGLNTQNYGLGFIAGESRELVEVDILVNSALNSGTVQGYLYQNSSNGASGSGTYIATFTQATTATSYTGGVTNSYLLRLTGSANLTSGLKYWIYFKAPAYSGSELQGFGSTTPTATGSWSIVTSGASYLISSATNNFTFASYPTFKLIVSTPTTISLALNAGGNSTTYRTTTTLKAIVNSDGPVTFYSNGKVIPTCKKIQSVSGIALCSWKATVHGGNSLTARVVPTDSANYTAKTSTALVVGAKSRTTTR
jgi:hypothetical protein